MGVFFNLIRSQQHRHPCQRRPLLSGIIVYRQYCGTVTIPSGLHLTNDLCSGPAGANNHHALAMGTVRRQKAHTALHYAQTQAASAHQKKHQQPLHQIDRTRHEKEIRLPLNGIGRQRHEIGQTTAQQRSHSDLHQRFHARIAHQASIKAHRITRSNCKNNQHGRASPYMENVRFRRVHIIINLQRQHKRQDCQHRIQQHKSCHVPRHAVTRGLRFIHRNSLLRVIHPAYCNTFPGRFQTLHG